jgi:predicted DNA-binding protein (UPF0251 family)
MAWMRRRRRGGPGRPPKPRFIAKPYFPAAFIPVDELGRPLPGAPVRMGADELEALRLVYAEGLSQDEAAARMGVSRGTLWRLLSSARRKVAQALSEGRPIHIESNPPRS